MGKRIMFDVDGVFADFTRGMNQIISRVGPTVLPDDWEPNNWDWVADPGDPWVVTREQYHRAWEALKETPNFWSRLMGYKDSFEALLNGVHEDDDMYFVTSRLPSMGMTTMTQTTIWLRRVLGDYPFSVVVTKHAGGKRRVANAIDAAVSIDDHHANVRKLMNLPGHRAFLLNRPWNRKFHDLDKIRVFSVAEFLEKANAKV